MILLLHNFCTSEMAESSGKAVRIEPECVLLYNREKMLNLLAQVQLAVVANHEHSDNESEKAMFSLSENKEEVPGDILPDLDNLVVSDKMVCVTCDVQFADRLDQVSHFKSDWHRFNLKQKLKGAKCVSNDQFMEITGEISSISGSDTESDTDSKDTAAPSEQEEDQEPFHLEGIGHRHPRSFFRNQQGELWSVYRCVLHGKKDQPENVAELVDMVTKLPDQLKWLVVMVAGGHFAAAVFHGEKVVTHKTFHRYVVRAKRGTAQSTHDSQSGHARSVGAFMRRHHETALIEDIKQLLQDWSEHLKSCDRIFMRATGSSQKTLFGGKSPALDKKDSRLRMIPFPTRRPTFNEVKRVHSTLMTVLCYGTTSQLTDHISPRKTKNSPNKFKVKETEKQAAKQQKIMEVELEVQDLGKSEEGQSSESECELAYTMEMIQTQSLKEFEMTPKPKKKKKRGVRDKKTMSKDAFPAEVQREAEIEDTEDPKPEVDLFFGSRNELYTAVKVGNCESLRALLDELIEVHHADPVVVVNLAVSKDGSRLLHIAAKEGHPNVVKELLLAGADPAMKNQSGEFAYVTCKDKETRNVFRRFMAEYPEKYDYAVAQVPGPLTKEMEDEKKAKEAEKKKIQKKARKERLKVQKAEERIQKQEEQEKQRFLSLSDREKRALAAEKRFTSQLKEQGSCTSPVLSRCFLCGKDMTGQVPFEYNDNKFCTTKCLQQHRKSEAR